MIEYQCHACDSIYAIDTLRYNCDCGGALNLEKTENSLPA